MKGWLIANAILLLIILVAAIVLGCFVTLIRAAGISPDQERNASIFAGLASIAAGIWAGRFAIRHLIRRR